MKIAITADWHLDAVTEGILRYKDLTDTISQMLEVISQEKVSSFVFMGDLCNPDKGARTLRSMVTAGKVSKALKGMGITQYWVAGNHDVIDSDEIITSLSPLSVETNVLEKFEFDDYPKDGLVFLFLPYRSKMLQDQRALDRWFEAQCVQATTKGKMIFAFGHCTAIQGVKLGSETEYMPRGREQRFPTEIANKYGVMSFNGHYHNAQTTKSGVVIPGALGRYTFDEEHNVPGFLIVEV